MSTAQPMLAVTVSTWLATLALLSSASAEELVPAADSSDASATEEPAVDAVVAEALPEELRPTEASAVEPNRSGEATSLAPPSLPRDARAPTLARLAPPGTSWGTSEPDTFVEPEPRSATLGAWGIVTTVLGGGAMATSIGLFAAQEDGAAPTMIMGALVSLTGVVMTSVGYSSPSVEESSAGARRSGSVAPKVPEPSWEERQSSRETRRNVGIGLTVVGVALGAGGGALIGVAKQQRGGMYPGIEYGLAGLGMVVTAVPLVAVGIPFWAENAGDEPRPPVRAELGIGPGSIELRGSF